MRRLIDLQDFTVLRADNSNKGVWTTDGEWVKGDGSTASFNIKGSLQPVSGKDLNILPDGMKSTNTKKLYTTSELKTLDDVAGTEADRITIDGSTYEVFNVEKWTGRRLSHFKVLLVEEEKTG